MTFLSLLLLAIGLSMDAFAVSISQGATQRHGGLKHALRTGLIFGLIEGLTPSIGWGFGLLTQGFIAHWSHWLAFVLLLLLGGRMLCAGWRGTISATIAADQPAADQLSPHQLSSNHLSGDHPTAARDLWLLILTAIATSIDALAIGVSLAFLQVNIVCAALIIGIVSAALSTLGIAAGRALGPLLGRRAEILGGLVLIGIGCEILLSQIWR